MAEELNQDGEKAEWLQKVLSRQEFIEFLLAQRASRQYVALLERKEPNKKRSSTIKRLMEEFMIEIGQIIEKRKNATLSERDTQIEGLIQDAKFKDDNRFSHIIYYHFRSLTDQERIEWDDRMDQIFKEIYGIDMKIFDK